MSQKRKHQRANHEAQEKKQGEKVIMYIMAGLAILAVAYAAYTIYLF